MLIAARIEINTFLIKDVVSTNGGYFYGGEKVDTLIREYAIFIVISEIFYILPLATLILIPMEDIFMEKKKMLLLNTKVFIQAYG